MSNSPIGSATDSAYPAESVYEEGGYAGALIGFLQIGVGRCLIGESSEAAAFGALPAVLSQGAKLFVNSIAVSYVFLSFALCVSCYDHSQ